MSNYRAIGLHPVAPILRDPVDEPPKYAMAGFIFSIRCSMFRLVSEKVSTASRANAKTVNGTWSEGTLYFGVRPLAMRNGGFSVRHLKFSARDLTGVPSLLRRYLSWTKTVYTLLI
ncbi:hypothetical protein PoB_001185300 [Plakobranchus ocellatus]|uniref:Uncharacterized protein n=1 Tax=Plakobranchus ocellatus TaxID=259542 RepID=A0AAV3YSK3_9GAST|nr:hypothetical protein PoB_001185300 [Plakobranchus ocellatus]